MTEDDLIAALEHLDRVGAVPGDPGAPSTFALQERVKRENAVAWDDSRQRYVLTGTGRLRIAARHARAGEPGRGARGAEIRPFPGRGNVGGRQGSS